MTLQFIATQLP